MVQDPRELTKDILYESSESICEEVIIAVVRTIRQSIEMKSQDIKVLVCLVMGALVNGPGCAIAR